jgi:hypothetical protein
VALISRWRVSDPLEFDVLSAIRWTRCARLSLLPRSDVRLPAKAREELDALLTLHYAEQSWSTDIVPEARALLEKHGCLDHVDNFFFKTYPEEHPRRRWRV